MVSENQILQCQFESSSTTSSSESLINRLILLRYDYKKTFRFMITDDNFSSINVGAVTSIIAICTLVTVSPGLFCSMPE